MIYGVSIRQPWASLLAAGVKQYETRSWATRHRGLIALCASRYVMPPGEWAELRETLRPCLEAAWLADDPEAWPRGVVVGLGRLTGVVATTRVACVVGDLERRAGDWRPGRVAWHVEHAVLVTRPILCRGAQGVFALPGQALAQVISWLDDERNRTGAAVKAVLA